MEASASSLVSPACVVCGGERAVTVCDAAEVRAQLEWVERFHLRRLKPGPSGRVSRRALEDRSDFTQGFVTNVVACVHCGLVARDPRPNAAAIAAAYAQDEYGEERLRALFTAQRELYREKVRMLRRWLPPGSDVHVVEIGSFVGGFLAAATTEGWTMRGIDPGEEVSAFCAARGLPVVRGTLEDLGIPPRSIDCVAVWNTFDQLPDPATTVAAIAEVVRPEALVALRVSNGLFFRRVVDRIRTSPRPVADALRATLAWNNLLGFPYLYGYSLPTLTALLGRFGFAPVHAEPDTLVRLSDATTRLWARGEERLVKLACRAAWTLAPHQRAHERAPWLDVYFRRLATPD